MSRLERKRTGGYEYIACGGLCELMDNSIMETFHLKKDDLDYIYQNIADEDIDLLDLSDADFTKKRKALKLIETLLSLKT